MAKKVNISQLRNQIRQAQSKQQQAINKLNQSIRQANSKQKQAVNRLNSNIRQYNQHVRQYNARLRQNRQRIAIEFNRLNSKTIVKYEVVRTSSIRLNTYYHILDGNENRYNHLENGAEFLDLSEKESANSLNMANILEEDNVQDISKSENNIFIENALLNISNDLLSRWKGALFSMNPSNPDAGRHFCTSSREIFISILDYYAPDSIVIEGLDGCEYTNSGSPTRKSKIKYILQERGFDDDSAVNFVNEDIDNILQLFRLFNDGTHGSAGHFSFDKLVSLERRVEDGLMYLTKICNY